MADTPGARRPQGRPAHTIARIALGCGNFGGVGSAPEFFGQGLSEDQAREVMDAAWESGITHFDTAAAYGGGRSELWIGRWIAARGIRPQLTTKTYNPMQAGADHGLRPERIARQLHASLDRLGVQLAGDPLGPQAVIRAGLHRVVGLGRQLWADSACRDPAADPQLAAPAAVGVGGVEVGDAGLPGRVHHRACLVLGQSLAEELRRRADPAEVAAAERDRRNGAGRTAQWPPVGG